MIYWINLIDWNGHVRVSINLWIEEIYFKMHKFIQIFIIINSFKAWYNCWKVLIPKLVLFHIKYIENRIQIWVISLTSYSLLIKLGGKSYSFFFVWSPFMICFYFIVIIGKIFEYYLCLHLVIKDTFSRNEVETRNEQVHLFTYIAGCYCRQDRCERQLKNVFDCWFKVA